MYAIMCNDKSHYTQIFNNQYNCVDNSNHNQKNKKYWYKSL